MLTPRGRISITSLFTVATVVPLLLVGILLLALAVRTVNQSSESLGKQILEETSRRVDEDISRYLDQTRRISDLLAGLVSERMLLVDDYSNWTNRFFLRLRTTPEVSSICFTNEALDTIYLMRYPPELEFGLGEGNASGSTMRTYEASFDGRISPTLKREYAYDPRTRPWWKIGHAADSPIWTPAYQWFNVPERRAESVVAVAYTRTVRDEAGNRLGVLSVDATLDQVSEHLAEMAGVLGAFILITDADDRVLSSSMKLPVPALPNIKTLAASEQPSHRHMAGVFALASQTERISQRVELDDQTYWVKQVTLRNGPAAGWTLTLAVPDGQLLHEAKTAIEWIKLLGTVYLTVAVLFSILLARLVTNPFRRLAAFASGVGAGRFDQRIDADSTKEFSELSAALNTMAANLEERVHLTAQKDAAQEASAVKARLIAHVSHEFRTPLNAIIGYGELLRDSAADSSRPRDERDARNILMASKHLLNLINNLLDLSRVDAGKLRLDVIRFDVRKLVEEIDITSRPVVEANDNAFECRCEGDVGEMCSDPARIKQILINLLGNSAKFTSNGVIRLLVRSDGMHTLRFLVSDTGAGMTSEQLSHVFEPFTQVHEPTHFPGEGAGLGLAITKQLCDVLGGSISVTSEVGKGTLAEVILPRNHQGKTEFRVTADPAIETIRKTEP